MKTFLNPDKKNWPEILKRPLFNVSELYQAVQAVLNGIKIRGDEALREYTQKFDGVQLDSFAVSADEINEAEKRVDSNLKDAILFASENIPSIQPKSPRTSKNFMRCKNLS